MIADEALVTVDNMTYTWSGGPTIGPISIELPPGRLVAVIGPNGAGKSTLLKLMAGFLPPATGTIVIGGRELPTLTAQHRAQLVAFVPQSLDTSFDLTVEEVVRLGYLNRLTWRDRLAMRPHVDADRLDAILHKTGLHRLRQRPFTTLSGGEARRVLLAAALVQDTPLLLLDEPTTHLDPGHAVTFLDLVREMVHVERKTVVMAYHDLASVGLYADELWVMHRGQLVAHGDAQSILSSPLLADIYRVSLVYLAHPQNQKPVLIFP